MWEELFSPTDRMRRVEIGQNIDGRLVAFGVAPDDTVWFVEQPGPGVWGGAAWSPFYTPADQMRELRVARNADGRMEVFGVAPDDSVWRTWQDSPGGAWIGSWQLFYSGADRMSSLDVGENMDGRLECFGVAPDDSVWRTWQTSPGVWTGAWTLFYSAADRLRHVRAARNVDGRMEVFATAPDDTVWRTAQPAAGNWAGGGWTLLQTSADEMRTLEVGQNFDGRLEVVGIAPNDTVWRIAQNGPGNWMGSGWVEFYSPADELAELRVGRNADGRLAVFGVSSDEQIWFTQQNAPGNWIGGWTDLTAHIRVLLKTVTPPTRDVNTMMANMRAVFATVGIKVGEGPRENITVRASPMAPPQTNFNVGPCQQGTVTGDQALIFVNRNNAGSSDIVLYFVTMVTWDRGVANGCAAFPSGQPGAIVAQGASLWTIAHEVGHVLGLDHIDGEHTACPPANEFCCTTPDFTRLMTGCGTGGIRVMPTLDAGEASTMHDSDLIRKDRLVSIRVASNFDGRLEVFGTSSDNRIWHTWQVAANGGWNEGGA